jgi:hypothetical protein
MTESDARRYRRASAVEAVVQKVRLAEDLCKLL